MIFQECRNLVQDEFRNIDATDALLNGTTAVSYDMYDLIREHSIRRDLGVPSVHQIFQNNGYNGVELEVHLVGTRQRW